jgi:hypothetical protein
VGEKIRLLAHCAQQVQRHHGAGGDQARQQPCACSMAPAPGRGLPAPHAGFDKGRRGRRQLRAPGQIKAQGMLFEPALRVIEGEDGALLLAPVRRPCCLELLCYQESPFPRFRSRQTPANNRSRSGEMPAGFPSKHTAGRWDGHAGNWSGARFGQLGEQPFHARGIERGVHFDGRVAGDRGRDAGARGLQIFCLLRAAGLLQHLDQHALQLRAFEPGGAALMAMVRGPKGLYLKAIGFQFRAMAAKVTICAGSRSISMGMSSRWRSTCSTWRWRSTRSNSTRSWATC